MNNTQKNHKFTLLNVIQENGERNLKFIGIRYVAERGAQLTALEASASDTLEFNKILRLIDHISTDGENKKTRQHHDFWKLLDNEREKVGEFSSSQFCLCSAFYSKYIKSCLAVNNFFHSSA